MCVCVVGGISQISLPPPSSIVESKAIMPHFLTLVTRTQISWRELAHGLKVIGHGKLADDIMKVYTTGKNLYQKSL